MTEMENITEDKPICIIEVNENLRRVKLGMELTRPLKQLNSNCEFRKKYEEWCNIQDGLPENTNIKTWESHKTPEYKAKMREYQSTPKYRAKMREYYKTPEYKAKMREYQSTPKYKAKMREYKRKILKIKPENYRK